MLIQLWIGQPHGWNKHTVRSVLTPRCSCQEAKQHYELLLLIFPDHRVEDVIQS